jgi:hypothetical protein
LRLALLFLLAASAAYPQKLLSFGVKAGYPVKDALEVATSGHFIAAPSSGRYTLGPTVELNLPHRVSVEADLLYRRTKFAFRDTGTVGSETQAKGSEWRFPVLLKYRLKDGLVRPFIAGGPMWDKFSGFSSFNVDSAAGFVAAAGIEGKLVSFRLSGEVRYSHAGSVSIRKLSETFATADPNQIDLLVGITF